MDEKIRCVASDDEALFQAYLRKIIPWEEYGFTLCGVGADGEETLAMIRQFKPQLLLLDINMPKLNGLELLKKISEEKCRPAHCVIISGYRTFEYAQTAMRFSVENYLVKPFTKEELLECLLPIREKIQLDCETVFQSTSAPKVVSNPVLDRYHAILQEESLTRSHALLKKALLYIDSHYAQELTLQDIATALYVSQSYLRKVFANEIQNSVGVVLEEIRLKKACELLEKNMYYVSDIAEMVGYSNPTYFTKVFKKRFGITPSQYAVRFMNSLKDGD